MSHIKKYNEEITTECVIRGYAYFNKEGYFVDFIDESDLFEVVFKLNQSLPEKMIKEDK